MKRGSFKGASWWWLNDDLVIVLIPANGNEKLLLIPSTWLPKLFGRTYWMRETGQHDDNKPGHG